MLCFCIHKCLLVIFIMLIKRMSLMWLLLYSCWLYAGFFCPECGTGLTEQPNSVYFCEKCQLARTPGANTATAAACSPDSGFSPPVEEVNEKPTCCVCHCQFASSFGNLPDPEFIDNQKQLHLACCDQTICETCLTQWMQQVKGQPDKRPSCPACRETLTIKKLCPITGCTGLITKNLQGHITAIHRQCIPVSASPPGAEASGKRHRCVWIRRQAAYLCGHCPAIYTTEEDIQRHKAVCGGVVCCPVCSVRCNGVAECLLHLETQECSYICPYTLCCQTLKGSDRVLGHIRGRHSVAMAAGLAVAMGVTDWAGASLAGQAFFPAVDQALLTLYYQLIASIKSGKKAPNRPDECQTTFYEDTFIEAEEEVTADGSRVTVFWCGKCGRGRKHLDEIAGHFEKRHGSEDQ